MIAVVSGCCFAARSGNMYQVAIMFVGLFVARLMEAAVKLQALEIKRKLVAQDYDHLLSEEKVSAADLSAFREKRKATDRVDATRKAKVARMIAAPAPNPGLTNKSVRHASVVQGGSSNTAAPPQQYAV